MLFQNSFRACCFVFLKLPLSKLTTKGPTVAFLAVVVFTFMGISLMTSDASSILTTPFPLHCNYGCPIKKGSQKTDTDPNPLFTMGVQNDGKPGHWLAYYVTTTILKERDERRAEYNDPSLSILSDTTTSTPDFFWGNGSPAWESLLTMEERLAQEPGIAHTFVLTGLLRHYTDKTLRQDPTVLTGQNDSTLEINLQASLWKIISINTTAHTFVSAFIFPSGSEKAENYCPFIVDVSAIERETGFTFFPLTNQLLPEQRENHFQELHPYIECS
ncbi:hypothetical protein [Kiloniella majae]|uniref:hypothetical protein n=1 Tax=Kiloniella majae TaxID=1938558 RepID=UPI000A279383|nr:hypothetical protein [Kiloniella majae]